MPYTKVTQAVSSLDKIAQTIAVPKLNPPHRVPTFPQVERTAVVEFYANGTIKTGTDGKIFALMFNSPVYPLWVSGQDSSPGTAGLEYPIIAVDQITAGDVTLDIEQLYSKTFGAGQNGIPILGQLYGKEYIYVPQGTYLFVQINATITAEFSSIMGSINVSYYNGGDDNSVKVIIGDGATTPIGSNKLISWFSTSPVVGGWYAFSSVNWTQTGVIGSWSNLQVGWSTQSSGNPSIAPSGSLNSSAFMPFNAGAVPEFQNSVVPYTSTRSTATSALFQNVTKVLNKEGTVKAVRIPTGAIGIPQNGSSQTYPGIWSANIFTSNVFVSAHPKETYYGPLEKGLYAFCLPDQASMRFTDSVISPSKVGVNNPSITTDSRPCMDLEGFQYVNCIEIVDFDATNPTQLAVEVSQHLEFRTASQLFQLGFSKVSMDSWHAAMTALSNLGVFYENPTHLRKIAMSVASATRTAAGIIAPHLLRSAAALGKQYVKKKALEGVVSLVRRTQQMHQSTPGSKSSPNPPPRTKRSQKKSKKANRRR